MHRTIYFILLAIFPLLIQAQPIQRKKILASCNPTVTSADSLSSLSVGNGHFATTVDITGMQSFPDQYRNGVPLCAMSDWGWHSFPNKDDLKADESYRTMRLPRHSHDEVYAVEYKKGGRPQAATNYYRVNPHRLNLGTIGLTFTDKDGTPLSIKDITDIHQQLDLYTATITSCYSVAGSRVQVTTACMPASDATIYRINTPLLRRQASVFFRFPYPTGRHADDASDWNSPSRHTSRLIKSGSGFAIIERQLDSTRYYLTIRWKGDAQFASVSPHHFQLNASSASLDIEAAYSESMPEIPARPFSFDESLKEIHTFWASTWQKGGFVDFSSSTDPRASELQQRICRSQYLTLINCANAQPPQETGLTYNSWFGRPHLEMTWWHAVHFALWNRPDILRNMMKWYTDVAFPEALKIAERQGYKGARWMKMTDPKAGEAPSNTGSFLIWQQPHFIYMAEQLYSITPSDSILKLYATQVEQTAEWMADFAIPDIASNTYQLWGATAMQETMRKDFSYNHPFELAYWRYGLEVAQKWRQRQGQQRRAQWDEIIHHLSPLPVSDGIYMAGQPIHPFNATSQSDSFNPFATAEQNDNSFISQADFNLKSSSDHPAVIAPCALLPSTKEFKTYDTAMMDSTLNWVLQNWNWPTTWGWDYGMLAMAAIRLGHPSQAIDILLSDYPKNRYLVSGHNFQTADRLRLYLPGNGALLTAIALLCTSGDDEKTDAATHQQRISPTWQVRWESLLPLQ